jgi:hypothetical protein
MWPGLVSTSGALNGQGGGDIAPAGVQGGQQASADPGHQRTDVEHDGQAEVDARHTEIVRDDIDRRIPGHGDLVGGQVHQFGAVRIRQGTPRRAGQVMNIAPPGDQQPDQVDIQEPGCHRADFADGGLAGHLRQVGQGVAKLAAVPRGQDFTP